MSSAREERAKLEAEFNRPGSTMPLPLYNERAIELERTIAAENLAAAASAPAPSAAPAPAPPKPRPELKTTAAERAKALANFDAAAKAHDYGRMIEISESDVFFEAVLERARECKAQGLGLVHAFVEVESLMVIARIHRARIGALEARIKALEERPTVKYRGVFDGVSEYRSGDAVTHRGTLWFCSQDTKGRPGEADSWRLMVKEGR